MNNSARLSVLLSHCQHSGQLAVTIFVCMSVTSDPWSPFTQMPIKNQCHYWR